jgi:sialate O-acetylesterase
VFTITRRSFARYLVVSLTLVLAQTAYAELRLPSIFSDHMVLQAGTDVPVWGWADPGQDVNVQLGAAKVNAKADAKGKWMAKLPAMKADADARELVVTAGTETVKRADVLVGEVWIGSGQSNMAMTVLRSANSDEFVAAAKYPQIRLFQVGRAAKDEPADNVEGKWVLCSPETVGPFSAALYHLGRNIHEQLKVPVGLINSSWGGTPIQAWMPAEAFDGADGLARERARIRKVYSERAASRPAATRPTTRPAVAPKAPAGPAKQLMPATLFDGMIAPLIPYAIRGVTWYQGENNVHQGDVSLYAGWMQSMVGSWRRQWAQGDWAFLYVQLAPFGGYKAAATALPEMWEQQTKALTMIPNSGMAPISDLGNVGNIHPTNKHEVGRRLALIALANTYKQPVGVFEGPMYRSHKIADGKVQVRFTGVGGGLVSRDGKPLDTFEIAGDDGKFVPAEARIEGDEVVVESDAVAKPAAVRFGWSATAMPNLANKEGLPAMAFRTK